MPTKQEVTEYTLKVMRRLVLLVALLAVWSCGGKDNTPTTPTTSSAPYSQQDLVVGTGAVANAGNSVNVAYTLWLYDSARPEGKGTQIQSNPSFPFVLGTRSVIAGWDRGVPGMRVGGQRRLIVPPDLAYGNTSPGGGIPPNATLVFDITLNNVQ
jgi:FKBP-type peptidyl-prolyl cis-trans isomerase FkpA